MREKLLYGTIVLHSRLTTENEKSGYLESFSFSTSVYTDECSKVTNDVVVDSACFKQH